jgi:hypothetical protein
MPEEQLFTAWNMYDMILYQIFNTIINHSNKDGAIKI